MIAIACRHPTIRRFAIADGVLHIGGLPVGLLAPTPTELLVQIAGLRVCTTDEEKAT